jgi:hypothetical protein
VGVNADDLEPTLNLATELINKGISRASMLFVVDKVPDNGEREAMETRQTIKNCNMDTATTTDKFNGNRSRYSFYPSRLFALKMKLSYL